MMACIVGGGGVNKGYPWEWYFVEDRLKVYTPVVTALDWYVAAVWLAFSLRINIYLHENELKSNVANEFGA